MRRPTALLPFVLGLGGCRGCHNDHPFVPYAIGADGEVDAEVALAVDAAPPPIQEISATQAPPHAMRWSLGGVDATAPPGTVFELGVARDFDDDGRADLAALVRRDGQDADLGQLVFYRGGGDVVTVGRPPVFRTPAGATCQPRRTLSAVGRHSVWLELGVQCSPALVREAARAVFVWSLRAPQPRELLSAYVIDPPGAPKLTFSVDASDADGDGLDDVLLRATVEGGDAPFEPLARAEASVRWFDRPAGMSRDPDAPDGSLRSAASALAVRAARVKEAPLVLAQARAVRVLWSAFCAEGQGPRIVRVFGGSPLSCAPSRALEEAGLAEARAYAALADPLSAVTAFDRAQVPPATRTPSRAKDAEGWINQVAPFTQAGQVRAIAAVPQSSRTSAPAWGALAFEPSGKLLVRTAAGVVRVDPEHGDETDATEVPAWPTSVVSPDNVQRWLEAYDACDGVSLHATLMTIDAGDLVDVPLPIASRLGTRCTSAKGAPAQVVPLAWGAGGLEALIAGEPILIVSGRASRLHGSVGQPPRGSARSPDGKSVAFATSLGVLVEGATSHILRAPELDGTYGEQRECTAANDGAHVACVRAGKAWVGSF